MRHFMKLLLLAVVWPALARDPTLEIGKRAPPPEWALLQRHLAANLHPASLARVTLGMKRYVNRPTYAFPWHGEALPAADAGSLRQGP